MSMNEEQILTAISVIIVAIQAYLVYRVDRARLKIEKYIGIGEKCELEIKPQIQSKTNEIIVVTNKGTVPIEEIMANLDLTVSRRNEADLSLHLKWGRKTLLSPKETTTIPLHEKLWNYMTKNNLAKLSEGPTFTVEDPETGEDVEDTLYTADLIKTFSILLDIQIASKVQGETNSVRKKYQLNYSWRNEPFSDYEDNYYVTIFEHMGEWTD